MLNIIAENLPVFVLAVLFGLATAWWIWGYLPSVAAEDEVDEWAEPDDQAAAEPVVELETEADSEPDVIYAPPPEDEPVQLADHDQVTEPDAFESSPDRERHPPEYSPSTGQASAAASIAAAAATIPSLGSDEKADGEAALDDMAATPAEAPNIAPAIGAPDDLKRIKGIGPKLERLLNSLGVTRFDQIAAWNGADVAEVDAHLASFRGRIIRDEWRVQAGMLAEGHVTEHRNRFGA